MTPVKEDPSVIVSARLREWNKTTPQGSWVLPNSSKMTREEMSKLSQDFSQHMLVQTKRGLYRMTAKRTVLDNGMEFLHLREGESDTPCYTLVGGFGALCVDDLPAWLTYEQVREGFRQLSEQMVDGDYLPLHGAYVRDGGSYLRKLVDDKLAMNEQQAIIIPIRPVRTSWETIRDKKRRWTVRTEVKHALDAGCRVVTSLGVPTGAAFDKLLQSWIDEWSSLINEIKNVQWSVWYMQACVWTILNSIDKARVVNTQVFDDQGNLLFVSLATTTKPGWLVFSHILADREALASFEERKGLKKPVRATYLALESLWNYGQEWGMDYIDLGGTDNSETSEEEWSRMRYKTHYRSATPPEIDAAMTLCFSNPKAVRPFRGINSFAAGKLVREVSEAWWLDKETGDWPEEEDEEEDPDYEYIYEDELEDTEDDEEEEDDDDDAEGED